MSAESTICMAAAIAIGLALLGLSAYMYDFLERESPRRDDGSDVLPGFAKFYALALAPFRFIAFNARRGRWSALVPFSAYLLLLAGEIVLGHCARAAQ